MRRPALLLLVLGASLIAAFHGHRPARSGPEDGGGAVVARIAGEPVTATELSAFWYRRYREAWFRAVDNLVDERIVAREARRLGLTVPPHALQKALADEVAARETELRETYGEEMDLATEVQRGYGIDLETWKREILEPRLRMQLTLMRVVRLDTRRRPRLKVRVIVLPTPERARAVVAKLRQGADFSLTALQESVDPTAQVGGDLPSIARGDLAFSDVEVRLFAAAPGALVGPLSVSTEDGERWHVYKVIRKLEPWTGTRAEVLARLETDLQQEAVGLPEYERWRARMHRDFRVEVLDPQGRTVKSAAADEAGDR